MGIKLSNAIFFDARLTRAVGDNIMLLHPPPWFLEEEPPMEFGAVQLNTSKILNKLNTRNFLRIF